MARGVLQLTPSSHPQLWTPYDGATENASDPQNTARTADPEHSGSRARAWKTIL